MKIKIRFEHSKKSSDMYFSPSIFHYGPDCSTGPAIRKGDSWEQNYEIKQGDTIVFSSSKWSDEPHLKIYRGKKLLNSPEGAKK